MITPDGEVVRRHAEEDLEDLGADQLRVRGSEQQPVDLRGADDGSVVRGGRPQARR